MIKRYWEFHNTASSYGIVSRLIHWISAITVIALFSLGLWMVSLDYYHDWYRTAPDIHRSVGVLLMGLTLLRLVWYGISSRPRPLSLNPVARCLAVAVHHLMVLLLFMMFFSGYLITTAQGDVLYVFDWFTLPAVITGIDNLEDIAGIIHKWSAFILIGLAGLHALTAFKHHFINKDKTLRRMLWGSH